MSDFDFIDVSSDKSEPDFSKSSDSTSSKNRSLDCNSLKHESPRASSPFDYYNDDKSKFMFNKNYDNECYEEDSSQPVLKVSKLHDISNSEDEDNCDNYFNHDVDSGFDYDLSQSGRSTCTSQSSQLTQSNDETKAAKAAERQRKKMEKEAAKADREREREQKRRAKEEKVRERQLKKEIQFKKNQIKPNECLKYMNMVMDEKLFRTVLCSKAVESFPHSDVKFSFKEQPVEKSITWTRIQLDGDLTDEDWVAIMWPGEDVAKAITERNLISTFKNISNSVFCGKTIILLIFAMDDYHRKSQNARSSQARREAQSAQREQGSQRTLQQPPTYLTREEIEMGLVELQLLAGICHRHFNNYHELSEILANITRAIAEKPFKSENQDVEKEMGWYARSAKRDCVRANKDMQGLDRLWIQQLSVFNNCNVDTAKAITSFYPTPSCLIQAYENCSSQTERELLLKNIQVKRSGSSSAVSKRLGPELSKRICLTFTETDGDVKLSSKSK